MRTMYGDGRCAGTGQLDVKRKTARRRLRVRRRFKDKDKEEVDLVEEGLRTPARFGDRRHNNYFQASNLSCPRR